MPGPGDLSLPRHGGLPDRCVSGAFLPALGAAESVAAAVGAVADTDGDAVVVVVGKTTASGRGWRCGSWARWVIWD